MLLTYILLIQITTAFLKDNLLVEREASDVYVRLLRVTLILFTFSFFLYLKYLRATSSTAWAWGSVVVKALRH